MQPLPHVKVGMLFYHQEKTMQIVSVFRGKEGGEGRRGSKFPHKLPTRSDCLHSNLL